MNEENREAQAKFLDMEWWTQHWKKVVIGVVIWFGVVTLILYFSGHFEPETIWTVFLTPVILAGITLVSSAFGWLLAKILNPLEPVLEGTFKVLFALVIVFGVLFGIVKLIKWIWYF